MKTNTENTKSSVFRKIMLFLLFAVIGFYTYKPLLENGFFAVHDNVQVERVYEMAQALKDGQFPVRMVRDLGYGYGYPVFNFYAPLPYYFGGAINALGIDEVTATKLMFLAGIIASFVFMYALTSRIWGKYGALVASVLFAYSPFHALDIYVRGAAGEFWAYAILPLVFLSIFRIFQSDAKKWVLIGGLSLSGVILSHNLTAFMLVPFIAMFAAILILHSNRKKILIFNIFCLMLLSALLSAFYWLPALWEMGYSNVTSQIGAGADFHKHFINLSQIWDFPWGFGGSAGVESGISYKIGKMNIVLWIFGVLFFAVKFREIKSRPVFWLSVFGLILSAYLTTRYSVWIWELLTPMSFLQFPWRFLVFSVFFSCLLAGSFALVLNRYKNAGKIISFILIAAVIYYQAKYFNPQYYIKPGFSYTGRAHLNWSASKISDEYLPKNFITPKTENEIIKTVTADNTVRVKQQINSSTKRVYQVEADSPVKITLPVAGFPGWKIQVDGQLIDTTTNQFPVFVVAKGKHLISAEFVNTPVRSGGNLLTLLGILFIGVILRMRNYEKI